VVGLQISRVKTFIENLDESLQGRVPKGHLVLLAGAPGTMKSSIAYSILYQNALKSGTKSLYMTLEQSREGLNQQMESMGMDPGKVRETVNVLDLGIIRKSLTQLSAKGSWMQVFKMYAENLRSSMGYEILVLHSRDVLEMAAQMKPEERRAELFYMFEWLRDMGVTCFLISECNPDQYNCTRRDEAYLADGVILLKMAEIGDTDVQRRIRIVKMRSTNHASNYFSLLFDHASFRATRVMSE
jgi:KaiC/GvpD/RAD55 family RecA-like ATPase